MVDSEWWTLGHTPSRPAKQNGLAEVSFLLLFGDFFCGPLLAYLVVGGESLGLPSWRDSFMKR